jgi:hypothetical protein
VDALETAGRTGPLGGLFEASFPHLRWRGPETLWEGAGLSAMACGGLG